MLLGLLFSLVFFISLSPSFFFFLASMTIISVPISFLSFSFIFYFLLFHSVFSCLHIYFLFLPLYSCFPFLFYLSTVLSPLPFPFLSLFLSSLQTFSSTSSSFHFPLSFSPFSFLHSSLLPHLFFFSLTLHAFL